MRGTCSSSALVSLARLKNKRACSSSEVHLLIKLRSKGSVYACFSSALEDQWCLYKRACSSSALVKIANAAHICRYLIAARWF